MPKQSRSGQPRVVRLGHHPSVRKETWSLSLRALEPTRTLEKPRCKHTKACLMDVSQTLKQTWPRERPRAAMCVQDVDVQCVLQFTLSNAASCALHRLASRVIHRSEVGFGFVFKGRELFRTLPSTVTRKKIEKFGAALQFKPTRSIPRCGTAPFQWQLLSARIAQPATDTGRECDSRSTNQPSPSLPPSRRRGVRGQQS